LLLVLPRRRWGIGKKLVGYERIVYYVMRLGSIRTVGILCGYLFNCVVHFFLLSSPYLLVFGDDHVMCYIGANDVAGLVGEA